jgi:hypothetical protein
MVRDISEKPSCLSFCSRVRREQRFRLPARRLNSPDFQLLFKLGTLGEKSVLNLLAQVDEGLNIHSG